MVHSYYRVRGGECESFEAEAEGLRAAGVEVRTLSRRSDELSALGKVMIPFSQVVSRTSADLVRKALDDFQPDILHIQNTFPLFPRNIYDLAYSQGVPVVQSLRNYRFICVGALLMREGLPCEECIEKSSIRGVEHGCYNGSRLQSAVLFGGNAYYNAKNWRDKELLHFVTASDFSKSRFVKAGWNASQIYIKPNLIPEPEYSSLGWKERSGAIFVGRLSEEKGIRELLKAWSTIKEEERLVIVGSGPLEGEVRDAAAGDSRIFYVGRLDRTEVMARISSARVLVLPSICYETFGRTLAEAAAVGTPTVASAGGALEELAAGSGGKAVDVRDARLLGDAVRTIMVADEDKWNKLSVKSRAYYDARLSPGKVVETMMNIYRKALVKDERG